MAEARGDCNREICDLATTLWPRLEGPGRQHPTAPPRPARASIDLLLRRISAGIGLFPGGLCL
jgi:hypothetical protein